ncbi:MAG: hypothetical protein N2747_11245 [Chitinophagaceae bacterium]|nr:hypothetical protein [Chitinophagaceae bacterium]
MYKVKIVLMFSWLAANTGFLFAQQPASKAQRVVLLECENSYSVMPVNEKSPFGRVKTQLIKQLGAAEYAQLSKRGFPSMWPGNTGNYFQENCSDVSWRTGIKMYKIATYQEKGVTGKTAILRIPYAENKDVFPDIEWSGNLYLEVSESGLMPWSDYEPKPFKPKSESFSPSSNQPVTSHLYYPKAGDILRYEVNTPEGEQYEFVVTLRNYVYVNSAEYQTAKYPVVFSWKMGDTRTGEVFISRNGFEKSTEYVNYFSGGEIKIYNKQSSVFLSQKNFSEAGNSDSRTTTMNMTGHDKVFLKDDKKKFISVSAKGRTYSLPVFEVRSKNDEGNEEIIVVQDSSVCPLIVEMKLDFHIRLKEIVTSK